MNARVREQLDYAEACGFHVVGKDGNGHWRLEHSNGSTMAVAATPGDYRGDTNNRALMRRLSGVTPDLGKRAGKFRKGVSVTEFVPTEVRVDSVSAEYDRLLQKHRVTCEAIEQARADNDVDGARRLISYLFEVRALIEGIGRPVPTLPFRLGVA